MTTIDRPECMRALPKKYVPSYMQPTRSSKLKENMYGTEFKFVPKRAAVKSKPPSFQHDLGYLPPRPPSPGHPRFMEPTRTSKGKVSSPKRSPRRRSPTKQNRDQVPRENLSPFCRAWRDEIAKQQRRTSSFAVQNSTIIGHFEEPPSLYRRSTGMEMCKKSFVHTAPLPDLLQEASSDSQMSTVGPSTPSIQTPRRPKNVPRYMLPTTSSAARIRQ